MAIRITTPAEPLSPLSFQGEPALIESDGMRLLTYELRRYCAGEVNGRSFLISGHRGAGKTTLVNGAFMKVLADSQRNPREMLRPLFVPLHGPNLLPDPRRRGTAQSDGRSESGATSNGGNGGEQLADAGETAPAKIESPVRSSARDDTDPEMQVALVQITLALHRAVCREMAEHYRRRILRRGNYSPENDRSVVAALELAAQLELELYQWPTAMRLREFWERAGVLRTGILHYEAGPDQGLQELVALASVCDSYRRISGTLSQTEKGSESGSQTSSASIEANASGKDFFGPLISLLTGGAVGTGLTIAGLSAPASTFAGAISALASALTLKGSASRSRTRSRSREDNFLFDLSVATLDRVLPHLVQSLRRCGLAPIFVVDELDKVVGLQERIVGMVLHLKKLVAESAFFCFLTDRVYFEQLLVQIQNEAFPSEHTYFTHRVFVVFRASDMRKYLTEHVLDGPSSRNRRPGSALPGATPTPPPLSEQDEVDRALLPYMVLHRARMHPIDLQREIAQLRNEEGSVSSERTHSSAAGFDLLIQLAIETVMRGTKFTAQLDREPAFHRVAIDAMYYLSRLWEERKTVDVRDDSRDRFEMYLNDRVGRDGATATPQTATSTWPSPGQVASKTPRLGIPEQQTQFLFECVHQLASLLADPELFTPYLSLSQDLVARPVIERAADLLRLDPPLLEETSDRIFEWCYDPAGRQLRRSKKGNRNHLWKEDSERVEALNTGVKAVLGTAIDLDALAAQYRVLPTSPPWAAVDQAISRLKKFRDLDYVEREEDHRNLAGYIMMLERNVETIGRAIRCAVALGAYASYWDPALGTADGLAALSHVYELGSKLEDQVSVAVASCWSEFVKQRSLNLAPVPATLDALMQDPDLAKQLSLKEIETVVDRAQSPSHVAKAWLSVAKRLTNPAPLLPDLSEVICAAAKAGPAKYSSFVSPMTVAQWSNVLAASLEDVAGVNEADRVPTWFAPVAMAQLGFESKSATATFTAPPIDSSMFPRRGLDPPPQALPAITLGLPRELASLIVKIDKESLVDRWAPRSDRSVAALALTQQQMQQSPLRVYLRKIRSAIKTDLFQQLVIEMPAEVAKIESAAASFFEVGSLAIARKFFLYPSTPPPGSPSPYFVTPTSIDQILPVASA
jgi:hypothetical protein